MGAKEKHKNRVAAVGQATTKKPRDTKKKHAHVRTRSGLSPNGYGSCSMVRALLAGALQFRPLSVGLVWLSSLLQISLSLLPASGSHLLLLLLLLLALPPHWLRVLLERRSATWMHPAVLFCGPRGRLRIRRKWFSTRTQFSYTPFVSRILYTRPVCRFQMKLPSALTTTTTTSCPARCALFRGALGCPSSF